MSDFETVRGLVLRGARYKESGKILTVLTAERGRITVSAHGAFGKSSRTGAAIQTLCYSEFTLRGTRGRWTAMEASSLEQFLGLRDDISLLALGTYFADLLDTVCTEDTPAAPALQLALNALYALSRGLYSDEHIKSVTELRLLTLEGFQPDLDACALCGEEPDEPLFAPREGLLCCRACASQVGRVTAISPETLAAMRYIVRAPAKKEFSFLLPEGAEHELSRVCEDYTEAQLDKRFSSLDYWKKVR